MRTAFTFLAHFLLLSGCQKSPYDDLAGTEKINGLAIVIDTLSGPVKNLLSPTIKVYLRYSDDPAGFLYSTISNDQGQFNFNGIDTAKAYIVYANENIGELKYYGELTYPIGTKYEERSDTLKLFPSQKDQNGIHVIVEDSLGGRVINTKVYLYNSNVLFNMDTIVGYIFSLTTNEYGVANQFNMASDHYQLRALVKSGIKTLFGEKEVSLGPTG